MDFAIDKRIPSQTPRDRAVDLPRIEAAVREILIAIGENPDRDGLRDTPSRVARAYQELSAGLREDPSAHLKRVFDYEGTASVCVKDIEFFSLCEHHMLPFFGKVQVTYQPQGGKVFGLSKLARLVDGYARRLQVQERLSSQIADAVMDTGLALSVSVEIEAEHLCMCMRGARVGDARTVTVEVR
jgi:GTP cyclohydrolase IA